MSELHDKDGMLKKSVPDKGAETFNRALGSKGASEVLGVGNPFYAMAAMSAAGLDSIGGSDSLKASYDDKPIFSADTVMFVFTDEQRKYLLVRHNASKLSDMAYDSEVGGTIISRAMSARKDVESLRDALNLAHEKDSAKSGVKFSDVIDAKDDAAKSLFMNSGLGDEDAYYDKMREDYMKSISDQLDKESSKSDDKVEASSIDTKAIDIDDPDLPMDLDDPDVPADYRNPDGSINAKYNSDDGMDY